MIWDTELAGYTMAEHAASVAWLLDQLKAAACILIGHSMGGAVAIELATARPDLVTKLVLAGSNLEGFDAPIVSEEEYVAHVLPGRIESLRQEAATRPGAALALGMWQIAGPRAFYRSRESLRCGTLSTWQQHLYNLVIPRLFVFGEPSLPDPDTEALPTHGIEIAAIPNAGHGMMWDNPAGFVQVVAGFVAR